MYIILLWLLVCSVVVQTLLCELCLLCLYADDLLKLLNDFYRRTEVRRLAAENGLDGKCDLTSCTFVAVAVAVDISVSFITLTVSQHCDISTTIY